MDSQPPGFLGWVRDLDVIGLGALFIYSLWRRWLMWGSDCDDDKERMEKRSDEISAQRDEYKELVDQGHREMKERLDRLERGEG